VSWSCLGPGKLYFGKLFDVSPCDGLSATSTLQLTPGRAQQITVTVSPTTTWRLVVQDSA
jgi:hypothetical protein